MTAAYTQDDLESDINHLRCLLDQGVTMMQGLPHIGDSEQEIADAIIWVARDLAKECCDRIAAMPARSIGPARMTGGDRPMADLSPIMALFEQWNHLRDHSDQPGLDDDELDRRCAQTDAVMKQIGQLPATSAADFAAKLSCITHYGAYSNLGGDCGGLGSALICEAAALCGQAEKVSRVPTDHQARGQRNG
jgi:hypothetical protein